MEIRFYPKREPQKPNSVTATSAISTLQATRKLDKAVRLPALNTNAVNLMYGNRPRRWCEEAARPDGKSFRAASKAWPIVASFARSLGPPLKLSRLYGWLPRQFSERGLNREQSTRNQQNCRGPEVMTKPRDSADLIPHPGPARLTKAGRGRSCLQQRGDVGCFTPRILPARVCVSPRC
jgi:hypothetical protein